MKQETDEIIWRLCLKGDSNAFAVLYRRYYPVLLNYGKIYSKDTDFVQNCLQNFFVRLITNYTRLSPVASVRFYLLKAFRHTLYNELKSKKIREGIVVNCPDDVLTVQAERFLKEEEGACRNILVSSVFNKLSSRQQEILYLYYIRELTHEEIAGLLNIRYQSSKNLLLRALAKLRSLLLSDRSWEEE